MSDTNVVVYLHGHGSRPADIAPEERSFGEGVRVLLPQAPHPVSDEGFSWFESSARGADRATLEQSIDTVNLLLDAVLEELSLTDADLILGGFSQGAATALAVAATRRAPLGGLLLQAPFVPEGVGVDVELANIGATRILIQHNEDDEVIPIHSSQDLAVLLVALGHDVQTDWGPGAHARTPKMVADAVEWVAKWSD